MKRSKFDYSSFTPGYYHEVLQHGSPVRRAWHRQKFQRVLACLPQGSNQSLLDIGCFAGSFLSLVDRSHFTQQIGVDILESQVNFANTHFATQERRFLLTPSISKLELPAASFDCITIIEVIEHLTVDEVSAMLDKVQSLLKPGGKLILTTPNYCSTWPILELIINRMADVNYEEQHITKFNFFNFESKLNQIAPKTMSQFKIDFKTTTHFLSPFVAAVSEKLSDHMSTALSHQMWAFPLGNLILARFTKN